MAHQVELRRLRPGDAEFCFEVHRAALGEYVDAIWGWDEPVQRAYHEQNFDAAHTRVITVDGRDAGVLTVEETGTEVVLGARAFYERLGFVVTGRPREHKIAMRYTAP